MKTQLSVMNIFSKTCGEFELVPVPLPAGAEFESAAASWFQRSNNQGSELSSAVLDTGAQVT